MQVEEDSHATDNEKRPRKELKLNLFKQTNCSIQIEEFAAKSIIWSQFFNQTEKTLNKI